MSNTHNADRESGSKHVEVLLHTTRKQMSGTKPLGGGFYRTEYDLVCDRHVVGRFRTSERAREENNRRLWMKVIESSSIGAKLEVREEPYKCPGCGQETTKVSVMGGAEVLLTGHYTYLEVEVKE